MYNKQYLEQLKLRLKASSIVLDIPLLEIPSITTQLKRIGVTEISRNVSTTMDILVTSKYTQYKASAKNLIQKGFSVSSIINNRFTNQLRSTGTLDFTNIMYALRKKKSIIHLSKIKEFLLLFERSSEDEYSNSFDNLAKYSIHVHLTDTSGTYNAISTYFDKKNPAPQLYMHSIGSPFVNLGRNKEMEIDRMSINHSNTTKRLKLTSEEKEKLQWEDLYEKRVNVKKEGHCYICGKHVKCFSRHLVDKDHLALTNVILPNYSVLQHLFENEKPLLSSNCKSLSLSQDNSSPNSEELREIMTSLNKRVGHIDNGTRQTRYEIGKHYAYFDLDNHCLVECKLEEEWVISIQPENLYKPFIYNSGNLKAPSYDQSKPTNNIDKIRKLTVDPKYIFNNKLIAPFHTVKVGDLFLVYIDPSVGIETVVVSKIHPDNRFVYQVEAVTFLESNKNTNRTGERAYEKKPYSIWNRNIEDFKYKIVKNKINTKDLENLIKNENIIISTLHELNAERYKVEDNKNDNF